MIRLYFYFQWSLAKVGGFFMHKKAPIAGATMRAKKEKKKDID